jgi:hypothetical protein
LPNCPPCTHAALSVTAAAAEARAVCAWKLLSAPSAAALPLRCRPRLDLGQRLRCCSLMRLLQLSHRSCPCRLPPSRCCVQFRFSRNRDSFLWGWPVCFGWHSALIIDCLIFFDVVRQSVRQERHSNAPNKPTAATKASSAAPGSSRQPPTKQRGKERRQRGGTGTDRKTGEGKLSEQARPKLRRWLACLPLCPRLSCLLLLQSLPFLSALAGLPLALFAAPSDVTTEGEECAGAAWGLRASRIRWTDLWLLCSPPSPGSCLPFSVPPFLFPFPFPLPLLCHHGRCRCKDGACQGIG